MEEPDVTEKLLPDSTIEEEVDESKFDFVNHYSISWSIYYASYLFNNSLRGFFLIYFLSSGTGFRWIIAANIFQTLVGDLILSSYVSYHSDRMENKVRICGGSLGHRKYFLALALLFAVTGAIGMSIGCFLDNSLAGCAYMIFSTLHYCGQATMEIIRNPYLIENTSCQTEYVKVINYYTVPPGFVATLFAGGIFFVIHPVAAVVFGFFLSLFGLYKFFNVVEAPNPGDIQPEFLPAIRITIDNPIGWRLLLIYTCLEISKSMDGLLVTVIQLNFNIIKRTSDLTYLLAAGAFIVVPVVILGVYNYKKELDQKHSDKYQMYIGICWRFIATYCVAFILSASAYYNENTVWAYLFLGFFVLTYLQLFQGLTQNVLLRDACMLDTMYTGINRFSLYGMTLTRPSSFFGVVAACVAFVSLRFTGYNELEDDTLDDRVDTRIEYTNETLWLLRCLTTIGPICMYSSIILILYNYPLNEIQSKRLERLVEERSAKEIEKVSQKDTKKQLVQGSGAKDDINIFLTSKFKFNTRHSIPDRKTFLEEGVQQAQLRLSAMESAEVEMGDAASPIRSSAPAYLNEEKLSPKKCKFDAELITTMLHFSLSELHELCDPTKITNIVLNNIRRYNTINIYLPLVVVAYMFLFLIYCFTIDDVEKVDVQSLIAIMIAIIGLFHYLRKSPLKMLSSLHADDTRKLATAGITARLESKEYLRRVLQNLEDEKENASFGQKEVASLSVSFQRLESWFQNTIGDNGSLSNHHNLNIMTVTVTSIISLTFLAYTFYFYASGHFW